MIGMKRILFGVSVFALCMGGLEAGNSEATSPEAVSAEKVVEKAYVKGYVHGHVSGVKAGIAHAAQTGMDHLKALSTSPGTAALSQSAEKFGKQSLNAIKTVAAAADQAGHVVYEKAKGLAHDAGSLAHKAKHKATGTWQKLKHSAHDLWKNAKERYHDIEEDF